VVLLAAVLALEAGMVVGLNTFADAKTAAGITLVQDYSAEVAATALLGDSVAAGNAPSGVSYADVGKDAGSVFDHYYLLKLPSELLDYAAAVADWAREVEAAATAAEGGKPWAQPPPPAFRLTMTADQAHQAFADSQKEVGTLVEFGNRALKDKNVAGIRYVGARLFAQYYWLFGVTTSLDNPALTGRLHFLQPLTVTHPTLGSTGSWASGRTAPTCDGGLCLTQIFGQLQGMSHAVHNLVDSCSSAQGTFNPSAACAASQENLGLVSNWAASVTGLSAPSGVDPTSLLHVAPLRFALAKGDIVSLIPPSGTQARVENLTVNPGEAAGATTLRVNTFKPRENWPICTPVIFNYVTYLNQRTPGGLEELIGSCASGQPVPVPSELQSFTAQCKASNGTVSTTVEALSLVGLMPTTEGGWTCSRPGAPAVPARCVSLLTYSGSEYQGGAPGCPQVGLGPEVVATPAPTYSAPPPPAPPTPQCQAGYTYSAADNLCHSQAPVTHTCPPSYPYYNPADNKCYTQPPPAPGSSTWYLHWSCGSSTQCAQVMGGSPGVEQSAFSSQADCQNAQATWAKNNTMQPYNGSAGSWCSTSRAADPHP
jgi:hypothetical protein